jgi:hypothetical protein
MWAETHAQTFFLVAGACRARAEGQRGRESMWAARTHRFLSPGTGAMPDTRSENESMLIEGELDAKGAGVEGDVPTWCGTPRMSAAGRFIFQAWFYRRPLCVCECVCVLSRKGPACWRAHVLVTLSFLWQPGLCMGRCGDGGRRPNVPNKAQCREVRRCGALAVAQTASQRRQSSVTSPQSSSFSAAPASSSASSGGESGRQPEWSPIHGDVSSHGPQLSLWGGVTRECG